MLFHGQTGGWVYCSGPKGFNLMNFVFPDKVSR
jgi:hypothetical protein